MSQFMALVVEDDALQRTVLSDLGLEVVECATAESAELVLAATGYRIASYRYGHTSRRQDDRSGACEIRIGKVPLSDRRGDVRPGTASAASRDLFSGEALQPARLA
jgi:hypothetical protein